MKKSKWGFILSKLPFFAFSVLSCFFLCFFVQRNIWRGSVSYSDGCFGTDPKAAAACMIPVVISLLLCFFVSVWDILKSLCVRADGHGAARVLFDLIFSAVPAVWFLFTGWSYQEGHVRGFFDETVLPIGILCCAALLLREIWDVKKSGSEREKKKLLVFNVVFFSAVCGFGIFFFNVIQGAFIISMSVAFIESEPLLALRLAVFPAMIIAFAAVRSVVFSRITSYKNGGDTRRVLDRSLIVMNLISVVWFLVTSFTPVGNLLQGMEAKVTPFDGFIFTAPVQAVILCIKLFTPPGERDGAAPEEASAAFTGSAPEPEKTLS